jgi:hypothetical protein
MAASSNYINKREKPTFNHIGGSSRPQPVPPKPPALNPASTSFSPVNMVYWGYWKSHDETLVLESAAVATDAVGITGTNPAATETGSSTASSLLSALTSERPVAPTSEKPATSQSGDKIPPRSSGSSVFQVSPASDQPTTRDLRLPRDEKTSSGANPSTTSSAGFTDQEIIQGVSGIVQAFEKTGWVDKAIISYFLTPGGLGYRQFPGITTELFVKAADGIIDVSSLVSGNKGGAGSSSSGSSSGGFNTRGLV